MSAHWVYHSLGAAGRCAEIYKRARRRGRKTWSLGRNWLWALTSERSLSLEVSEPVVFERPAQEAQRASQDWTSKTDDQTSGHE